VVYDSNGIAVLSLFDAKQQGTGFPSPSKFAETRATLRPVYSNIFEDPYSGEDIIFISVPIMGDSGKFNGVLVGMSTLKYSPLGTIYAKVLEFKAGLSGYAYLVDRNGKIIYHRHSSRLGSDMSAATQVMMVIKGEIGAVLTEDSSGQARCGL